jgi:hypothetical protein
VEVEQHHDVFELVQVCQALGIGVEDLDDARHVRLGIVLGSRLGIGEPAVHDADGGEGDLHGNLVSHFHQGGNTPLLPEAEIISIARCPLSLY